MDREKKILFYLFVLWILIFIIIQYNGSITMKSETQSVVKKNVSKNSLTHENILKEKEYNYPEISLKITNKDLFGELLRPDLEQKKSEAERKKVVTIQTPPLPPLPVEPKPKVQEKEPVIDELKDVMLMGILKKDDKHIAFFKKNRDIKSFKQGDKIFGTSFEILKIEDTEVVLKDDKDNKRILTVEKEVKDAKDKKK